MKICPRCNTSNNGFNKNPKRKDGLQTYCKKCQSYFTMQIYYKNKQPYVDRAKKSRQKRKDFVLTKKNSPCTDCHVSYPAFVMDFDHMGIEDKSFNLSQAASQSIEAITKEIAKCELVCSNCHRIRTHNRLKNSGVG